MKKIIFIFFVISLLVTSSVLAKNLANVLESHQLSNDVAGEYFANNVQDQYVVQTGHDQGDKYYGSGSVVSAIYYGEAGGDTFDSSSDFPAEPSNFDSTAFTGSGTSWTEMGEAN